MNKKILAYLILAGMICGSVGCQTTRQESIPESSKAENLEGKENSMDSDLSTIDWKVNLTKVPNGWKKPRILRIGIDSDVWEGKETETSLLGRLYPDIEKILNNYWSKAATGDYIIKNPKYTVNTFIYTTGEDYSAEETPLMICSEDTWVMNLSASCMVNGAVVINGEKVIDTQGDTWISMKNWDFEGKRDWVLRKKGTDLLMMTYADYAYARMTLGGEEDPFEKEWVAPDSFKGEYFYYGGVRGERPVDSYYFEPIQGYLYNGTTIYRYESSDAKVSEVTLQKAAIALGEQYMQELCTTNYKAGMEENYKIREYKDLTAVIINRTEGPVGSVVDITDESYCTWDWMVPYAGVSYGVSGLANLKNMWIILYEVDVKGDGTYEDYEAQEWKDTWIHPEVFGGKAGIMVKENNMYYMILAPDIVTRTARVY